MKNRLLAAGIAAPAALTLAVSLTACASSQTIDGQGGNGTSSSSTAGGSGTSSPSTPGSSITGGSSAGPTTSAPSSGSPSVSLAARLGQGLSQARTAHLSLDISAAGQAVTGSGDEQLSDGKLVALDLSETVANTLALRLIIVGGKTYVRLPSSLNHSGKPWQLVSARSKDATVKTLAMSLASTQSSASLSSVTAFVSAARSVKQVGSTGSSTTYAIDVNPAKLPGNFDGKQALVASGLTSIPITLQLDSAGRPLSVSEHLSVAGQKVSTKVTIGAYNKPVHITAPPASQVSTR